MTAGLTNTRAERVFRASRDTLLSEVSASDPLVASAQAIVQSGVPRVSIVTVGARQAERVDLWVGGEFVVSHSTADPASERPGALTPVKLARSLLAAVLVRSVGCWPMGRAAGDLALGSLESTLEPGGFGGRLEWLVQVSTGAAGGPRHGICVALDASGLLLAQVSDPRASFTLQPTGPLRAWASIEALLGL